MSRNDSLQSGTPGACAPAESPAQTAGCDGPSRYAGLDAIRFVAALVIMQYHCLIYANIMHWMDLPDALGGLRLAVDLFFVLSGFVLMRTYDDRLRTMPDFLRFLRRRLGRIYPLHAVTVLAAVFLACAASETAMAARIAPVLDPAAALPNLLLLQALNVLPSLSLDCPSWSISAEWWLYVLFPILARMVARLGGARSLVIAVGVALVIVALRRAFGFRDWTRATYDFGLMRALPTFIAGMAISRLVESHSRARLAWPAVAIVCLVIAELIGIRAPAWTVIPLFPVLVGAAALAERSNGLAHLGSWASRLGDMSYSLYLLHALIMLASAATIEAVGFNGTTAAVTLAVSTNAITLFLGVPVYRRLEQPGRVWLEAMLGQRGNAACSKERVSA